MGIRMKRREEIAIKWREGNERNGDEDIGQRRREKGRRGLGLG